MTLAHLVGLPPPDPRFILTAAAPRPALGAAAPPPPLLWGAPASPNPMGRGAATPLTGGLPAPTPPLFVEGLPPLGGCQELR